MELNAYTRTIRTLFSTNVKYIVPRFQREYSWTKEEVTELWSDIIYNVRISNGEIINEEYFIGSLVLIGEDRSTELYIVDGQQRLTTITILLSALVESFNDIDQPNLASAIYDTYIEGKDDNNEPFFKLVNENPKPFLQKSIQYKDKEVIDPANKEERKLQEAYLNFRDKLHIDYILKEFKEYKIISLDRNIAYVEILKKIRDQILSYLKVIYITVANEEDAYKIFETLNARGMNLSATDLIKNEIFKTLKQTHPNDDAKSKWKGIQSELASRETKISIDVFFRHHWLSKYSFVRESKIYKDFKKKVDNGQLALIQFLNGLEEEAGMYNIITNPRLSDWPNQDERDIYNSLKAVRLFQVTQVRTFLLAVLKQRKSGNIKLADFIKCLKNVENFHFAYTHICSLKGSIFEGKYSKTARRLRDASNIVESRVILEELYEFFKSRLPEKSLFIEDFSKLYFLNGYTKDKKSIQYIFNNIELELHSTNELNFDRISLEHLNPQSNVDIDRLIIGSIGNLLPIDKGLNQRADVKLFPEKLEIFKDSELRIVSNFINQNISKSDFSESDIIARTSKIAEDYYDRILTII